LLLFVLGNCSEKSILFHLYHLKLFNLPLFIIKQTFQVLLMTLLTELRR
jgi:hypothetical protein